MTVDTVDDMIKESWLKYQPEYSANNPDESSFPWTKHGRIGRLMAVFHYFDRHLGDGSNVVEMRDHKGILLVLWKKKKEVPLSDLEGMAKAWEMVGFETDEQIEHMFLDTHGYLVGEELYHGRYKKS